MKIQLGYICLSLVKLYRCILTGRQKPLARIISGIELDAPYAIRMFVEDTHVPAHTEVPYAHSTISAADRKMSLVTRPVNAIAHSCVRKASNELASECVENISMSIV